MPLHLAGEFGPVFRMRRLVPFVGPGILVQPPYGVAVKSRPYLLAEKTDFLKTALGRHLMLQQFSYLALQLTDGQRISLL